MWAYWDPSIGTVRVHWPGGGDGDCPAGVVSGDRCRSSQASSCGPAQTAASGDATTPAPEVGKE